MFAKLKLQIHGDAQQQLIAEDEENLLSEKQNSGAHSQPQPRKWGLLFVPKLSSAKSTVFEHFRRSWKTVQLPAPLPILLYASLLAVYTTAVVKLSFGWTTAANSNTRFYTPAREAMIPDPKLLSVEINKTSNIYNQPPSPEVDKAWAALFNNANVRISQDELNALGRTSIPLADGSGDFMGSLDVYHHLHCLKYIRQYVHQDYYELGHTNVPNKEHVNHCIEMLRQVIMCHPDTAMMTYSWLPDFPGPWPNFAIEHECLSWNALDEWAAERSFDVFDPKYLNNPQFGFPYEHLVGLPKPQSESSDH